MHVYKPSYQVPLDSELSVSYTRVLQKYSIFFKALNTVNARRMFTFQSAAACANFFHSAVSFPSSLFLVANGLVGCVSIVSNWNITCSGAG